MVESALCNRLQLSEGLELFETAELGSFVLWTSVIDSAC